VITVGAFFTILMVAGGIDLSVGGVLALAGVVGASLVNAGVPPAPAFATAVLMGAGVGALNGLAVSGLGVNTVIATLATLYLTRGTALVMADGGVIRVENPDYAYLGNASLKFGGLIPPIPVMILAMLVVLAVALTIERRTILGRYSVLAGSNPRGARLSGVPVRRTQIALFILTGAAAAWAGVMVSSRLGSAVSSVGLGFEFQVLIATLIGGTSLLGGQGSVMGLVIGALIVGSVTSGMNILGVQTFVQQVVLGLVLLGAVSLDSFLRLRGVRYRASAGEG
jgi:ribose/xylose/arabinose/galactoside ABC-type transport system permease subunit